MTHTIGVDVGGTKVAAVVVDEQGVILARARRSSASRDYSTLLDTVVETVGEAAQGQRVDAVGLAIAGNVAYDGSSVLFSPHLPLSGEPLREHLRQRLGLPVTVENDANAAAWAEYRFGGLTGDTEINDLLLVTLGTGVGAGLILDGQVYRGHLGFAGEAGHMTVVRGGRVCPCGNRGCWERYTSGTALLAAYLERGGDPERSGPDITAAAVYGDETAREALADIGDWLGHGLASLVAVLDPGLIVVGGGVSESGDLLLEPARASFRASLTGAGRRPEPGIVAARFGVDAGVIGAAALAGHHLT
jgi:glucokinase